jgi:hypothetical protein
MSREYGVEPHSAGAAQIARDGAGYAQRRAQVVEHRCLHLTQQGATVGRATMRLLGRLHWWAPAPLRFIWRRIGLSEAEST